MLLSIVSSIMGASKNVVKSDPIDSNEYLLSDKPKSEHQKTDSAILASKKFDELPVEEKIALLHAKLKRKTLTKNQKKDIELEIKTIKSINFAEKNFSPSDGFNPKFARSVKKMMNDPDSFGHVKTTYKYRENTVIATMIYRSKNAFGAMVLGTVVGVFDYDGTLLEVSDANK